MEIDQQLLSAFEHMVRRDGGTLVLLSSGEGHIRFSYMPGVDEECATSACVLPHMELQQMMREWLSRRDPAATVTVQLTRKAGA